MTIVEDLLASFGWGVVVAGVINAILNYYKTFWQDRKKQQHEKELADKKDKREEDESAAGKKKIADEAKLEALEQGRKARAIDRVIFDKERNALKAKVARLEALVAVALKEKEKADVRAMNAQLRELAAVGRLNELEGQIDETVRQARPERQRRSE